MNRRRESFAPPATAAAWVAALCFVAAVSFAGEPAAAPAPKEKDQPASASILKTPKDRASYGIGLQVGEGIKRAGLDLSLPFLAEGIDHALSGHEPLLTKEEVLATMAEFQKELVAKSKEKARPSEAKPEQNAVAVPPAKSAPPAAGAALGRPTTMLQKASYSVGLQMGEQVRKGPIAIDPALLLKGLNDSASGAQPLMTKEEIRQTMLALQQEAKAKADEKLKALAEKNAKAGDAFLAANKEKEGVAALPSGLQYKVLKPGDGGTPKAADTVVARYRATLVDGTEIGRSPTDGSPLTFQVANVIAGLSEALQRMKVGAKWQLFIPSGLAYGEKGSGSRGKDVAVEPNVALLMEVELVAVEPPAAKPAAPGAVAPPFQQPKSPSVSARLQAHTERAAKSQAELQDLLKTGKIEIEEAPAGNRHGSVDLPESKTRITAQFWPQTGGLRVVRKRVYSDEIGKTEVPEKGCTLQFFKEGGVLNSFARGDGGELIRFYPDQKPQIYAYRILPGIWHAVRWDKEGKLTFEGTKKYRIRYVSRR